MPVLNLVALITFFGLQVKIEESILVAYWDGELLNDQVM